MPRVQMDADLRYHSAAPLATWLEASTLPYRARKPRGGLGNLLGGLQIRAGFHLGAAVLALPLPATALPPAASPFVRQAAESQPAKAVDWLCACSPLQRPPRRCPAFAQSVVWLGQAAGGAAVAAALPRLLPSHSAASTALWTRPQRLLLPISFPQFFARSVGADGAELPAAEPRPEATEVLSVPVGAALQSTAALSPLLREAAAEWSELKRTAVRRLEGRWAEDDLDELTEQLLTLRDAYAADEDGDGDGSDGGGEDEEEAEF
jgi:hypothetical protein